MFRMLQDAYTFATDSLEPWVAERNMQDQFGKVAIVTGGNSGIGLEVVRQLVAHQGRVIIASRDPTKGDMAVKQLKQEMPWGRVEFMQLELASFESVTKFAEAFKAKNLPLHMLINCAAEFFPPPTVTEDGMDATIQVNFFSHALLTLLLLDVLKTSAPARVVYMTSVAHYMGGYINWDDLSGRGYEDESNLGRGFRAYATSKLMLLMWAMELNRRLKGTGIDVFVAHPGLVDTPLAFKTDANAYWPLPSIFRYIIPLIGQRTRYGALPVLYTATETRLQGKGGKLFGPNQVFTFMFNTSERWPLNPQALMPRDRARLFDSTLQCLNEMTLSLMKGKPLVALDTLPGHHGGSEQKQGAAPASKKGT